MIKEQILDESLYFIFNKFEISSRDSIFKYPIPIRICLEYYYTYNGIMGDTKYLIIRKDNSSDTIELVVDDVSKKLLRLQVISSNQITFHNLNFNTNHYLNHNYYIAIEVSNNSFEKWEKFLPSLNTQIKIHVFNNTVVLILDEKACPVFMLSEDNEFGVLTDKNLNIAAFFINNIMEKDKIVIKEHATSPYSSNQESIFPFNTCETTIMENKQYLLKNINAQMDQHRKNNYDMATFITMQKTFDEYLSVHPKDTEIWLNYALCMYTFAEGTDYPEECLRKILEYDQDNLYAIMLLTYINAHDSHISNQLFEQLCSLKSNDNEILSMIEYEKIWYYNDHENYEKVLINSVELCDKHVWNNVNLGRLYIEEGEN